MQRHYSNELIVWSDENLKPAINWDKSIKKNLETSEIVIFFLSNGFISSDYIEKVEIKNALERFKQKKQIIVPVYIERISTKFLPFKDKQYLPSGTPLKKWDDQNDAWIEIQEGLIKIIDDVKSGNTSEYFE